MKKRIVAMVVVIAMIVALLPGTALAAGTKAEKEFEGWVQPWSSKTVKVYSSTVYPNHAEVGGTIDNSRRMVTDTLKNKGPWTFTAHPKDGYKFDGWRPSTGDYSVSGNVLTITYSSKKNYKATASFNFVGFDVKLDLGNGATFNDTGLSTRNTKEPYGHLSVPDFTVKPGYIFKGWSGSLDINSSRTLTAKYEYQITFQGNTQATITGTNPVWTVDHNVTPPSVDIAPGYRFDGWDRSLSGFAGPVTVTAKPCIKRGTISVSSTGEGTLTRAWYVNGTYDAGTMIKLNDAWPVPSHRLVGWRDNSTGQMLAPNVTITILGDCSYTAVFGEWLNTSAGDNGSLTNDLDGWYEDGTRVNLNDAQPTGDTGYVLDCWKEKNWGRWEVVPLVGGQPIVTIGDANKFRAFFKKAKYTVTFEDQNGNPIGTDTVDHGDDGDESVITLPGNTQFDTSNEAWKSELTNITSNKTITVALKYKVNYDIGSCNHVSGDLQQWIAWGGDVVVPSITPPDGHHFLSPMWSADGTNITAPTTISARYAINTYTVSFVDQNGNPFSTPQTVAHGSDASKPALDDPAGTRYDAGDTGWEAQLTNITDNIEIQVALEYKVTFGIGGGNRTGGGELIQWVAWDADASEPDVDPPTGNHFDTPKWDAAITGIIAPTTVNARYAINTYTVSFVDQNGNPFSTPQTVAYGSDASKPALDDPAGTRYDASDTGWEAQLTNIIGNIEIQVALEYKVTFNIGGGNRTGGGELVQWVVWDADASEPDVDPPTGNHFDMPKWDSAFTGIIAPTTVNARYAINTYTVSFVDQNGNPFSTPQTVAHGSDASKPALDDPVGTRFDGSNTGWEAQLTNITGNIEIQVTLEYKVAFGIGGGNRTGGGELEQWVAWDEDASEPNVDPPAGHHFDTPKWDASFVGVTAPTTVNAQYEINTYTVTFIDQNGNTIGTDSVEHGNDASASVITLPFKSRYDADNTAWRSEMVGIDGNKTIKVWLEYRVVFGLNGGSKISGRKRQWIKWGEDAAIPVVAPPTGYHFATPAWTVPTTNITAYTIARAKYEINTYTIDTTVTNGTITGDHSVDHGNDTTVTYSADANHHLVSVTVDGTPVDIITYPDSYTFSGVDTDHTIEVVYAIDTYTIDTTVTNGTITGDHSVDHGNDTTVTYSADANHHLVSVTVDGTPVDITTYPDSYTFSGVDSNHTIEVVYAIDTYTIDTTATNGTITGDHSVDHGNDTTVTYSADANHHLVSVTVDGTPVDITTYPDSYTFSGVDSNHTIEVVYAIDTYTIDTTVTNGLITGDHSVDHGDDTTVTYSADANHHLVSVTVDGTPVDITTYPDSYTFSGVDTDHTIEVVYAIDTYTIDTTVTNGTITPPQTVDHGSDTTVTYSADANHHLVSVMVDGTPVDITTYPDSYTFSGVDTDHTIEVVYAIDTYTVTFFERDGVTPIGTPQVINWDAAAVLETPPAIDGHAFDTWVLTGDDDMQTDSLLHVRENLTAVASYVRNGYTVTFADFDGTVLGTDGVLYGGEAMPPLIPEREGHTFVGWSEPLDPITGTITVTAQYEINTFTVQFVDHDGSAIDTQTVDWNTGATAPADPSREGYTFTGWDKAFDPVTENITVTAQYKKVTDIDEEDIPKTEDTEILDEEVPLAATPQAGFPWWWILIGVGAATGLFLILFFWKRRKKDEQEA